ncbi:uncharacterized protein LOC128854770 [Anastrepha ludens]|uniref:uncharacterized protein LOC128854770 n=1 Tax=Anastrepha ludens TaxID=28586 RepID=UPI0023B0D29D|nr:uncharacterized protein LOC128854770 [Anastrepha ludens]
MRVVNSCILELREYKDRRIVCQLKADYSANDDLNTKKPQGFHWLEEQHWRNFNAQLEQLLDNLADKTRSRNKIVQESFQLNDEVDVEVRTSSTPLKTLLDCLGHVMPGRKENTLALDFLVRRRMKNRDGCHTGTVDDLEYNPLPISSTPNITNSPYVPSKIGSKNSDLANVDHDISDVDDEDRYSPKLSSEYTLPVYTPKPINKEDDIFAVSSEDDYNISANMVEKSEISNATVTNGCSTEDTKIRQPQQSKEQYSSSDVILPQIPLEKGNLNKSEKNARSRRRVHYHGTETKYELVQRGEEKTEKLLLDIEQNDGQEEILNVNIDEIKESQDDINLEKYVKTKKEKSVKFGAEVEKQKSDDTSPICKNECKTDNQITRLRRSNRSPAAVPLRYKDKESAPTYKKKSKAVSKTMLQCFGSDGESDDFIEKTPTKAAPKTQIGSAELTLSVKKRKREEKNERGTLQQEQRSMSKWLTKKKPEELIAPQKKEPKPTKSSRVKETKKSETNCSSGIMRIVYPTPEEIANNERREKEQMKVNRKMKVLLEDLLQAPKKVKILSLNHMTADDILSTFPKYKDLLDDIFTKLRSKPKVTGYNGINHYSVIELIDNEKQLKIMNKLGEVYENEAEGTSMYSALFANALMPVWLVNIFKDEHNFSHNDALLRLNDQQKYMQYMDVEDNH